MGEIFAIGPLDEPFFFMPALWRRKIRSHILMGTGTGQHSYIMAHQRSGNQLLKGGPANRILPGLRLYLESALQFR
jgi:hypothetical protein